MKPAIDRTLILLLLFMLPASNLRAEGKLSPEAAYRQYIDALYRADPDQALEVITGPPDQMAFIRTFIACVQASNTFREKYIAAYGQAEWLKFAQDEPAAGAPAFRLPGKIPLETYRRLAQHRPVPRGSDYIVPQGKGHLRIIRQGERWYLAADSLGIEGQETQYEILAAVLREYQTKIGDPGITPSELRVALKRTLRQTGMW